MVSFANWLTSVKGKVLNDGQCVFVSTSWAEALNPGVEPFGGLPALGNDGGAKLWAGVNNDQFKWVANDHADVNQVPAQGDIMIFDATPEAGYTNQFPNPDGHTGVCDSANSDGYTLVQQNSPSSGAAVNVTSYPWNYRPCLGWLHPTNFGPTPREPAGTPVKTIHLAQDNNPFHLYKPGGPYEPTNSADVLGMIVPSAFNGGLTYTIIEDLGNGVYRIQSQDYGIGDIWSQGSDVTVE